MNSKFISKVISSVLFVLSLVFIAIVFSQCKVRAPVWDFDLICLKYNSRYTMFRNIIPAWEALCNLELINSLQFNSIVISTLIALAAYVLIYLLNLGRWFNSIMMFIQLFVLIPLIQMSICLCINSQEEISVMMLSAILVGVFGIMFVFVILLAPIPKVYYCIRRAGVAFVIVFFPRLKQQIIAYGTVSILAQLETIVFFLIFAEVALEILIVVDWLLKNERIRGNAENFQ